MQKELAQGLAKYIASPELIKASMDKPVKSEQHLKSIIKNRQLKNLERVNYGRFRECNTCPLRPVELENGVTISKCSSYRPDRTDCPIVKRDWIDKVRQLWVMQDMSAVEAMKYVATENMVLLQKVVRFEETTEGKPSKQSAEYLKLLNELMDKVGKLDLEHKKLDVGEKLNINQSVAVSVTDLVRDLDQLDSKRLVLDVDADLVDEEEPVEENKNI